ncbi:DUF1810 domain-containing protein [Sphingomonas arantia]|uniref:DUF1810 domain-containing protein n=1 Tax=Sphingomonas arantia TaxID=1460676 RepID=A0ABW4U111_9SPHN
MTGLERFVDAQADVYDRALREIRAGDKTTHWMWFVFPQIDGLGRSATARAYAIASIAEARAYLAHPVLGARLRECVEAISDGSPDAMFGSVDAMKLRSSLTLFAEAGGADEPFAPALARLFGSADEATLRLIGRGVQA